MAEKKKELTVEEKAAKFKEFLDKQREMVAAAFKKKDK